PEITFDEIRESEQMRFRLEQIAESLSKSEHRVLSKLIHGEKINDKIEKHSYHYLKKMRFISPDDEITVPLLERFLRENLPKISLELDEHKLLLNGVNVETHFSKKEKKALKLLLEQKNHIVARDQIGKALWPVDTDEKYSDWAVDRMIARIRVKLKKLGMPKEMVKTVRNRGYMLVN
ncbi:winged helix-turn-helix domain-containing protein, partial [Candidatus Roizmanbacteria bacterium]|nr:winged helix-turn-helix domain-containing protein [Candidatus Roizmanbacteria bacterium]